MKKGLLLSVVATGFIFAGGNIAPVAPVAQPQVAPAACDFWGTIAVRYDAHKDGKYNIGDTENNKAALAIAMGVEKQIGAGFGLGAEVDAGFLTDGEFNTLGSLGKKEFSGLSQLYVTYKAGNTAIKAGRQALPKAVSPLAFTERGTLGGVPLQTYNGVTLVNTDVENTTLVAAWVRSTYNTLTNKNTKVGDKGVFMLGAINKSIANTTLSFAGYYAKKGNALPADLTTVFGAAETKAGDVKLGLQLAYSKLKGSDKTFGVAAYAATNFNGLDAKLTLAYINDGVAPLTVTPGVSAFWGATWRVMGGNANGAKQKIARLDLGYKVGAGKVYGGVAADKADGKSTAVAARIGYDFKIADVNAKVEYRYNKNFAKVKNHRVRVQGVYKF
jgi:hypothetical protein